MINCEEIIGVSKMSVRDGVREVVKLQKLGDIIIECPHINITNGIILTHQSTTHNSLIIVSHESYRLKFKK